MQTSEEIELARIVYLAINGSVLVERFPKLVLDIHCTVLESDGSVASALINASSVALIHAGIEVKDVISSCTVSRASKNALCVDPSASEEATQKGNVVVSISPASGEVTYVSVSGSWDDQELQQALRTGITGCAQVDQTVRSTIIQQAS
jgi:ribonuclease PH